MRVISAASVDSHELWHRVPLQDTTRDRTRQISVAHSAPPVSGHFLHTMLACRFSWSQLRTLCCKAAWGCKHRREARMQFHQCVVIVFGVVVISRPHGRSSKNLKAVVYLTYILAFSSYLERGNSFRAECHGV